MALDIIGCLHFDILADPRTSMGLVGAQERILQGPGFVFFDFGLIRVAMSTVVRVLWATKVYMFVCVFRVSFSAAFGV